MRVIHRDRGNPSRVVLFIAFLAACCFTAGIPASANAAGSHTQLSIDVGWGDQARMGYWTPIFLTLSDPVPRGVTVRLYAPHDQSTAMRIVQQMTIGPSPRTYALYAPLGGQLSDSSITVYDDATRKPLTDPTPLRPAGMATSTNMCVVADLFVGISGRGPILRAELDQMTRGAIAAYLPVRELPTATMGYQTLDLLVLNSVDIQSISFEQQQAIANWVRAGGKLLLWTGNPSPPIDVAGNPLLELLPCRLGDNRTITLSADDLKRAGLSPRFRTINSRTLIPKPNATVTHLLGDGGVSQVTTARGLGQVSVLSCDAGLLAFATAKTSEDFWRPILESLVKLPPRTTTVAYGGYGTPVDAHRSMATGQIMDLLGTVPGSGQFGFSYVAGVLIFLLLIVGPIDWLVLRWLHRQPWTWVTTSGWIALVTVGGIYIGHVFKSGDLHFRTIKLIDQADHKTVATTDMLGIYSPRTAEYSLETPTETWWEPVSISQNYWSSSGRILNELTFSQAPRGGEAEPRSNAPLPMTINIWSVRFLESSVAHTSAPAIDAGVSIKGSELWATITNHTDAPLTRIYARRANALARLEAMDTASAGLAPGATLKFHGIWGPDLLHENLQSSANGYNYNTAPSSRISESSEPLDIIRAAVGLSSARYDDIESELAQGKTCIYAFSDAAPPAIRIGNPNAIEKHWQVIRALVSPDSIDAGADLMTKRATLK